MVSPIRRFSQVGLVILTGMLVLSGCATRKYVRLQTQALEPAIQEAQTGVKENAERIDAVDKRAAQGISTAQAAAATADTKAVAAQKTADGATQAAQAADRKADTANQGVQQAGNRINNIDTYTEGEKQTVLFAVNQSKLDDQAKSTLDKIASDLSGQRSGYMIELQGYTDGTGSEQYNIGLSQRRVESVERYLVSKNLPLFRVSVVGLGKENPIADNKTKDGRAQNRRVEIRVLKAANARQTN
ncbi:MAG: flagellar motor protein MotB [Acidobacteria bacterium]|nr:MAG: flagellar motor protein MotB [Acidobacteriota bacterium]